MPIIYGTTEAEYNALDGIRSSAINGVLKCPAKWKYAQDNPKPKPHFTLGSAVHAILLEKSRTVELIDVGDWRTVDARNRRDDALAAGKYPMNVPEFAQAQLMAEELRQHPRVYPHLEDGRYEATITGTDEATYAAMKARIDILNIEARTIVDLKTTASADPDDFSSHAYRFGYHVQAAHYTAMVAQATGTDPDEWTFLFALVEKEAPNLAHVTKLHSDFLDIGWADRREGITRYLECVRTGVWPGYTEQVTTTIAPRYALAAA
jgi:hypothetical protein